jgi:TIR domain
MSVDEDFWEDLLSHIRQQELIAVVGPSLTTVNVGHAEQTLTTLVGQRLGDEYQLGIPPWATTGDAVAVFLLERGRDGAERLYRAIYDIIVDLDPTPGDALRDLAAIDDLRLFVSMTPDRLLATAVNDVRFQGNPGTRELSFFPNQSTSERSRNAEPAAKSETVVLNLFGQAAPTPQYAIHEEDQLEWLYALVSDTASLPDWLDRLLHRPMLFIGCEISDRIGPFLLRWLSNSRLSLERDQQFFFVGSSTSYEPSLSKFFATYCRKTLVQQLEMEPTAFVAELRARWEQQVAPRPRPAVDTPSPVSDTPTIFISYMREDADAARRLRDAITRLGGDVWLDERLHAGDAWEEEVLSRVRRSVRLFVPVISANTEAEDEGYVFREWNEAIERSRSVVGRRFIVPVVIDSDYYGDASRYRRIPEAFGHLHFSRAPTGEPDAELLAMLAEEIRAMRREEEEYLPAVVGSGPITQGRPRVPPPRGTDAPAAEHIRIGDRRGGAQLSGSVFAPPAVESGATFLIQVFAHLPEHEARVATLAREFDEDAKRRGTVALESPVSKGERLAFELRLPGLLVDGPVQSMGWIESPQSVQFSVTVPPNFPPQTVIGTVIILRELVPIGHLKFKVSVLAPGTMREASGESAPGQRMHHYQRAFISYAWADRNEVLKRTQMLALNGIEFFQDILALDPGERWERRLYREIDDSDVFYLFWSSAAKKSTWVIKEVQYAMTCRGRGDEELARPEILPVIIEGPPPVEPPPELAHLHFNDRIIYFMQPSGEAPAS